MSLFVLEIGSEELPARFLAGEKEALQTALTKALQEANLPFGGICVQATPRRLAVEISDLALVQAEQEEVVSGPPVRIAYDEQGNPSKALAGFLKTQNLRREDLYELKTPKGVYLAAKRKIGGRSASEILAEILPNIIQSLPFPKRMRWGSGSLAYARPLHWILALLDADVVPFKVGEVESSRQTFGHRIHGLGPFTVAQASDYQQVVATQEKITLASQDRREIIVQQGNALASKVNGKIIWNERLLDEVEGLVEHPVPLLADFDPKYLAVPKEVLLTSMETHQKSFGVEDANGKLLPHFLTVLNLDPTDLDVVKLGWERVLHARLEDAKFFYQEDLKANFDLWLHKLEQVIFIGPLGSMADKTRRLEQLAAWIVNQVYPGDAAKATLAARAGRLSKADLVSGMVGEFDTLQGIMGGIYAQTWHEAPEVAKALAEQYLPAGPESPLPTSVLGAILSIADKADTLAGCFGLNKIPTGAADPNGLRRCALGIIRISQAFDFKLPLAELLAQALSLYGAKKWKLSAAETEAKLLEFLSVRLQNYLQAQGQSAIVTEAILGAGVRHIPDVFWRLEAFLEFQGQESYVENVQMLKRITNILQKQGQELPKEQVIDPKLFAHESEKELLAAIKEHLTPASDYKASLAAIAKLRPYVDNFFNAVMIMVEDKNVRLNRLALIRLIAEHYAPIVDFAALQI